MFRAGYSVEMLKVVAVIASLAVMLLTGGFGGIRFASAADLTMLSDVITDSAPSAGSDHTFTFKTPTGVTAGETIVIDFGASGFDPSSLDFNDIDFASTSDIALAGSPLGGTWGATTDATSITLTSGTGVIDANATVTIKVGLNATFGSQGDTQIANPSTEGIYAIDISAGSIDSGRTYVAILSPVEVTAAVATNFAFAVTGVSAGGTVNGEPVTGSTTPTSIPFGKLTYSIASTSAQRLTVETNAPNGYVVTVQTDGALRSTAGDDIDGFNNGLDTNTPVIWESPSAIVGNEETYGHWGFTSDDATTTRSGTDEFDLQEFAAASTTPRVVMSHAGPADGAGVGIGTTTVGFKIEISALQEQGDNYSTTLTYIATPTF
jgi:hypothetical protein